MLHRNPGPSEGSRLSFQGVGGTHVGKVRPRNEDAWAVREELRVAMVADGMGGHPAGDVAGRLAVDAFAGVMGTPPESSGRPVSEWMAEGVLSAHRELLRHQDAHPETEGMGTTLTGLHISEDGAWTIGHVGDSRAYLLRDSRLTALTRDQSPIRELVDAGQIDPEAARRHPMAHVLAQAVGSREGIDPEILTGTALPGDRYLLCSDGLTKVLSDGEVGAILGEGGILEGLVDRLVEAALDRGGPDNVTVVLVEIGAAEAG